MEGCDPNGSSIYESVEGVEGCSERIVYRRARTRGRDSWGSLHTLHTLHGVAITLGFTAPARKSTAARDARTAAAAGAREASQLSRDNRLADGWGTQNGRLSRDKRPYCVPLSVALWVMYPSKSAVLRWDRGSFWLAELATPISSGASKKPARTDKKRKTNGNQPPKGSISSDSRSPFRERIRGRIHDPRTRVARIDSAGLSRAPAPWRHRASENHNTRLPGAQRQLHEAHR